MPKIEIDRVLTDELERVVVFGPGDGTGESGDIEHKCYFAEIADQPIAFAVRKIFEELGQSVTSKLYDGYELWMIPHRISIMRRCGNAEVTSIGMEIEYLTGERTCSVVSLIPNFQYFEHGKIELGFHGSLGPTGEAKPTRENAQTEGPNMHFAGLDFSASGKAGVHFQYRATVSTPFVASSGLGSKRCSWQFDKQREPLFGRSIETWSIIALPKRQTELIYRMRFNITLRTLFFSTRRESGWKRVKCVLQR